MMKKTICLSIFTLLNCHVAFASSNKIDMDVELIRNGDLTQFKIHTQANESTSVINTKYYVEVKSENLTNASAKSDIKATFHIYEIKGKHKMLLMNPKFVLVDGVLATFITEDTSTKDIIQIKIMPHVLS